MLWDRICSRRSLIERAGLTAGLIFPCACSIPRQIEVPDARSSGEQLQSIATDYADETDFTDFFGVIRGNPRNLCYPAWKRLFSFGNNEIPTFQRFSTPHNLNFENPHNLPIMRIQIPNNRHISGISPPYPNYSDQTQHSDTLCFVPLPSML